MYVERDGECKMDPNSRASVEITQTSLGPGGHSLSLELQLRWTDRIGSVVGHGAVGRCVPP